MDSGRLLECLTADFVRLRDVVADVEPGAVVPSCPDWTVADLGRHVGTVYLHKVECMRLGSNPDPWPPAELNNEDPVALLDRAYAALSAEFAARAPESPAFTWYAPDQTVGFWIRRMTHETLIHRVDAELAASASIAEIPADVANDGVDELLGAFVPYDAQTYPDEYRDILAPVAGRTIRVATPERTWLVRLRADSIEVVRSDVDTNPPGAANADIRAAAPALLLWLWNRSSGTAVGRTGDANALATLRRALELSTQ